MLFNKDKEQPIIYVSYIIQHRHGTSFVKLPLQIIMTSHDRLFPSGLNEVYYLNVNLKKF